MNPPAIVILGAASLPVARQIQTALPGSIVYGLASRTQSVDVPYEDFGATLRELFQAGTPLLGICAAGILIRTLAPLLNNKWQEPPLLAIAEDGSAVVPLLGGLQGANDLARQVASVLQVSPAITTTGDLRFRTALLSAPPGYRLINPDDAKTFISNLLAGATVKLIGAAPWIEHSRLPLAPDGELTIEIVSVGAGYPATREDYLVYELNTDNIPPGKLAIVGTGPGSAAWIAPEAQAILQTATDWVGYKTYLDLAEPWRNPQTIRHESDNRVERDRARSALNLAAKGRTVAVVSSGDPGIYAMAAAVFEVLESESDPAWNAIEIQVCPGISAMQAAAAQVGAPLGHDFCTISLSDILKPWEVIAERISTAAQADFAIAFYNPVSQQRTWQLQKAQEILLKYRSPQTPVVLARNLGRTGQKVIVKTLQELEVGDADMRTVILIGSSQTRIFHQGDRQQWVYTPRYYKRRAYL
jgi:cobalt-precorrin 5A hydrolase / precorrin-3B C17-methyltransferase